MTEHRARVLTHCLMMQRLTEAVEMARELHPDYDVGTLFGREQLTAFLDARVKRILHEQGAPSLLTK